MAKFSFRLQTLLRLREAARDERRAQLAQAYEADEILRREAQRLGGDLGGLAEIYRQHAVPGSVNIDRLMDVRRFELVLQAQLARLAEQRQAIEGEIERRREALVEANREVRTLEKLRERQWSRHLEETSRREIRQLDEAASRRRGGEDEP